ncbi:MAG: hypothetical protein ABDH28_00175 [Brevinematia bacterium]
MRRFRTVLTFTLFLTFFVELSFAKWKIGVFDIMGFDTIGNAVANAIKRSSLLILSRDFQTSDIVTNLIDKNKILEESTKSRVDFSIYGFVIKGSESRYRLVLQLLDVANRSVKITKEYQFEYDTGRIFETIDSVVEDFKSGVYKVIPKYDETIAVEYRKVIEQRLEEVHIPGRFLISLNIISYFSDPSFVVYPSLAFRYINNSQGGLLGNGWFAGIGIPSVLIYLTSSDLTWIVHTLSKELSTYAGTKIVEPVGIGVDFLLFKSLWTDSLSFQLRPCIHINIYDFNIIAFLTFPPRTTGKISEYLGLKLLGMYQLSQQFGIEVEVSFDDYYCLEGVKVKKGGFLVGIGVFRSFQL